MTRHGAAAAAVAIGAVACVALGALLSTDAAARWMAHPARSATSRAAEAAVALRVALLVGPPVASLLIWLIARRSAGQRQAEGSSCRPAGAATGTSLAALALLVAAGLILRALRLDDSLWYDEIAGLLGYSVHGPGVVIGNYFSQANHVLSQLLIWAAAGVFGAGEIAVRLPSYLAGVALIPALWALGREARGEGFGLLAATAGTFLPLAIAASTDARGYALVMLLATLSAWLLLRSRRMGSTPSWCLYALVVALMVWTHAVALCVALGHGVVLLVDAARGSDRRGAVTGLLALGLAAVLTLALYAPIVPDLVALRHQFRAAEGDEPTLLGPEGWHALLGLGGSWVWWATIPGALLACVGLGPTLTDRRLRQAFLLTFLGGPIAAALVVAGDSWLYARFLLFLAPATALLVAAGLGALARNRRLALVAASAALATVAALETLLSPPRQPLREAIELAGTLRANRPVGVAGLVDQVTLYYSETARVPTFDLGPLGARIETVVPSVEPNAIVLLYPDLVPADRRAFLESHGYRVHRRLDGWIDWGRGAVEVWIRR